MGVPQVEQVVIKRQDSGFWEKEIADSTPTILWRAGNRGIRGILLFSACPHSIVGGVSSVFLCG